jgi:hypothetical protein
METRDVAGDDEIGLRPRGARRHDRIFEIREVELAGVLELGLAGFHNFEVPALSRPAKRFTM